jgi:HEAT repeat protein
VAGGCCLLLGAAAWWPVNAGRTAPLETKEIPAALSSADRPRRLAALRLVHDQKLDISAYAQYRSLLVDGGIAERYWLARALGVSRDNATYKALLTLTRDHHPNVVCQAYYALGRRKNRRAVPIIVQQLKKSRHWYAQWYGYRSLKALGWRQKPSL